MTIIDPKLKEFATERQAEIIDAVNESGGKTRAAKVLGVGARYIRRAVKAAEARASKQGYSPKHDMTKTAPDGFTVKGVSTLYDDEGEQKLQWVKIAQDAADRAQALREFAEELAETVKGKARKVTPPKHTNSDLLCVYPMGDPHIGLYAWHEETGVNFDLEIAERNLLDATQRLVSCAPKSDTALIANVGDFFHSDTLEGTTRRGTVMDTDGRWPKVLRVGTRVMRFCIEAALRKHKTVRIINAIGNHDTQTSIAMGLVLDAFYHDEPRVEVELSPARVHYHRFGKVLIGVTHGDKIKPAQLPLLMAADRKKDWGETTHRYWYTGHIHTHQVHDLQGVKCESFRTLAAPDAWTASMGYRSGRDMYYIVHHKEYGEIERHRIDVSMLCEESQPKRKE